MQPARLGALMWCLVSNALLGTLVLVPSSRAQAVLETPQQTNDRIRELSAAARTVPREYVIGNGDLLSIEVFDVPELSREVRVSQTGTVAIPLVPVRLHIAGLTEIQAEQKITEVLEANGLVTHPEVSVTIKDRKSKPITIVGAVPHPMVYQADRQVTLLEVLAEAGGVSNDAGDEVIITRAAPEASSDSSEPPALGPEDPIPANPRPSAQDSKPSNSTAAPPPSPNSGTADPPELPPPNTPQETPVTSSTNTQGPSAANATNTITVNLNQLMEGGNMRNNIVLQAGDVVTVPHAGIVYVLGAVAKPGGIVLTNDRTQLTTLKILALAGGFTRTAKTDRAVIIRKDNQGQNHEVALDLRKILNRKAEDLQLQASDILYVPESGAKQAVLRSIEFGLALGSGVALYRLAYH